MKISNYARIILALVIWAFVFAGNKTPDDVDGYFALWRTGADRYGMVVRSTDTDTIATIENSGKDSTMVGILGNYMSIGYDVKEAGYAGTPSVKLRIWYGIDNQIRKNRIPIDAEFWLGDSITISGEQRKIWNLHASAYAMYKWYWIEAIELSGSDTCTVQLTIGARDIKD